MIVMIDIPESLYTSLKERPATHAENLALYEYIINGTPVPVKEMRQKLEQESKTGHWINITAQDLHDYRTGNKLCYECSQCKSQFRYYFNFCPNCGCKMLTNEEVEENE